MKMDYVLEGDHLIVGNKELITVELKLSTGKVKRGDIVDKTGAIITDTGKVFGVVAQDTDATKGATKTVVYTEGEFNIDKVNFGSATNLFEEMSSQKLSPISPYNVSSAFFPLSSVFRFIILNFDCSAT